MRNLTVQREKTWVAAMVKMKVYIEDVEGDLVICGVRCRKLGVVKNGESATFQISEGAAKLFVIGDKLSRNYSNELYILPEGQEDVVLTGKNKFNLFAGNAFRFDNNESPEVMENRKRGKKLGTVVFTFACLIGLAIGWFMGTQLFAGDPSVPKTFSKNGVTITLNASFRKTYDSRFTACFESKQAGVCALKEPFSAMAGFGNKTLKQYGELVIQNNSLKASEIKTENGLTYFTYESADGSTFGMAFLYKEADAFWLVQCLTEAKNAEELAPQFMEWASTVKFS